MMCNIFSVNIKCVRLVSHIHDTFEVQINELYERLKLFEYVIKNHKHLYLYREVLIARHRHLNSEDCILGKSALLTLVSIRFCYCFVMIS